MNLIETIGKVFCNNNYNIKFRQENFSSCSIKLHSKNMSNISMDILRELYQCINISNRDSVHICVLFDESEPLNLHVEDDFTEFIDFYTYEIESGNSCAEIHIDISKNIVNNCLSVYMFNVFEEFICGLNLKNSLICFNDVITTVINTNSALIFEIFDCDNIFFRSNNIVFSSHTLNHGRHNLENKHRINRIVLLEERNTVTYITKQ